MKKLLGIIVLGLLLSGNAYAGLFSKICKFSDFKGKRYTGNDKANSLCGILDFDCEKTAAYKKHIDKYKKCKASGGKDPKNIAMENCANRSQEYSSEIRKTFYKDCMDSEGW
tara:strand:+ start:74 stop:409 length:336 start_codon:yes stop_codon:yes gene_type:complete